MFAIARPKARPTMIRRDLGASFFSAVAEEDAYGS